jgi:hypothetical protein
VQTHYSVRQIQTYSLPGATAWLKRVILSLFSRDGIALQKSVIVHLDKKK